MEKFQQSERVMTSERELQAAFARQLQVDKAAHAVALAEWEQAQRANERELAQAQAQNPEALWTDALADDLQDWAHVWPRIATVQERWEVLPAEYEAAGYPSEEDEQEARDQAEGETEGWHDDETLPLFGSQWHSQPRAASLAPPGSGLAMLAGLGAWLGGFFRAWPRNAPLLT